MTATADREELAKRRTVIEQATAWLDRIKAMLVGWETNVETWLSFHWIAFVGLFSRKIN